MTAALVDAIRAGDLDAVRVLLRKLDKVERRASLAAVTAMAREIPGNRWDEPDYDWTVAVAIGVAGLGCETSAAAAAKWIITTNRRLVAGNRALRLTPAEVDVLDARDPEWLADLTYRLSAQLDKNQDELNRTIYPLCRALQGMAGCASPANDGFLGHWRNEAARLEPPFSGADTAALLPLAIEADGFGAAIEAMDERYVTWDRRGEEGVLGPVKEAIAALPAAGVIDRAALIDQCAGRLVRGGGDAEMWGFWRLLDRLNLTEDELARRAADWGRVAADGPVKVAGPALETLRQLSAAGRLDVAVLAESARDVLSRPERALVNSGLTLLTEALRPGEHAAELLPVVATAFRHEVSAVQQKAWKLVARHLDAVGETVRAQVAGEIDGLAADLRAQASAVLGQPAAEAEHADALPPIAGPHRLPPPPDTVSGLVEELTGMVADRDNLWPLDHERVLGGLVRAAHRDRAALIEALNQVPWDKDANRWNQPLTRRLGVFVAVLTGTPLDTSDFKWQMTICRAGVFCLMTTAYLREVAERVASGELPGLLATPEWSTGAIDPETLLSRLTEYAALGVRPGPIDLEQALLRVRLPAGPDRVRFTAAAASLGTAAGDRLATWSATGGLEGERAPLPVTALKHLEDLRIFEGFGYRHWLTGAPTGGPAYAGPPVRLKGHNTCHCSGPFEIKTEDLERWVAIMPHRREHIAERMVRSSFAEIHSEYYAPHLTLLVQAGGPAGPAVHELMAEALTVTGRADTPGVVDAILQLCARGEFDAGLCGDFLGRKGGRERVPEPVDVLSELARAGAPGAVWGILAGALPHMLADEARRPRKMAALLSLAADTASACGASGVLPGLDEVAGSKKSSQTVKQAKRLRDYLTSAPAG